MNLPRGLWRVLQDEEKKATILTHFLQIWPRTKHFQKLIGFEAKAKNLTFEAKAENFKMCFLRCPRGQGRFRGLYLWIIAMLFKIKLIFFLPKLQKNLCYFCLSHFAIERDTFKQNYIGHCWCNRFDVLEWRYGMILLHQTNQWSSE